MNYFALVTHLRQAADRFASAAKAKNRAEQAEFARVGAAHLAEAGRVMGPSSGTDSAALDDGSSLGDVSLSPSQPGGSRVEELDPSLAPGGSDEPVADLDDADGAHPHGSTLEDFGYEKTGDTTYQHSDGSSAEVGYDEVGVPKTTLSDGSEFTDLDDLGDYLTKSKGGQPVMDDEKEVRKFCAEHGGNLEAVEHVRREQSIWRAHVLRSRSDISFESWLKVNPPGRRGGMIR